MRAIALRLISTRIARRIWAFSYFAVLAVLGALIYFHANEQNADAAERVYTSDCMTILTAADDSDNRYKPEMGEITIIRDEPKPKEVPQERPRYPMVEPDLQIITPTPTTPKPLPPPTRMPTKPWTPPKKPDYGPN